MEKMKAFFSEYGDKVGLGAAAAFFLAILASSHLVAPDVTEDVRDVALYGQKIDEAVKRQHAPPATGPVPLDLARVSFRARDFGFRDMRGLIYHDSVTVTEIDMQEGEEKEFDYIEHLDKFEIERVEVRDSKGLPTRLVSATPVDGTRIRFTAHSLQEHPSDWNGQFTVYRRPVGGTAVQGTILVRKIRAKPQLMQLPEVAGAEFPNPLDPGQVRLTWKEARVDQRISEKILYRVERCDGEVSEAGFRPVGQPLEGTSWTDRAALSPGVRYHYRVRALVPTAVVLAEGHRAVPAPAGVPPGKFATVPSAPASLRAPGRILFRWDGLKGIDVPEALFTFWWWDVEKRAWEMYRPVVLRAGDEAGLEASGEFRGTGIMVTHIFNRAAPPEIRLSAYDPSGKVVFDTMIRQGQVYRLMSEVVREGEDCVLFDGDPPSIQEEDVRRPDPRAGQPPRPVGPGMAELWKVQLEVLHKSRDDADKRISDKEFDAAQQAIEKLMADVRSAEAAMQGEYRSRAAALKGRVENLVKKLESERKKHEEHVRRMDELSPFR